MKQAFSKYFSALTLATVLSGGIVGCSTTPPVRTAADVEFDQQIASRVRSALASDAMYKYPDIQVNAYDGSIQLSGFALSSDQKAKAAEIARAVTGVRDVVNNINVRRTTDLALDQEVASRVRAALAADSTFKYPDVQVNVSNGTVRLSGMALTPEQRAKAADLARAVTGVQDVVNEITVGRFVRDPVADEDLAARIRAALASDTVYKFPSVQVNVANGTVQLNGFAVTPEQRARALELVRSIAGAVDVVNNLVVRP